MALFGLFTSREEKNILLIEIIKKLSISEEEKELYILSITILEEKDFEEFYTNIKNQISSQKSTIAPFSPQLI